MLPHFCAKHLTSILQRKKCDAQSTKFLSSLVLFVLVGRQAGEIKVTTHVREIVPLETDGNYFHLLCSCVYKNYSGLW